MALGLEDELSRVSGNSCNANLSLLREEAMRWLSLDSIGRLATKIIETMY